MASKYLTRSLRVLGGIFRFPGQRVSPPGIDLDQNIQPVLEVGRLAERGSGYLLSINDGVAGTANTTVFDATVIEDQLTTASTIGQRLLAVGLDPNSVTAWLIAADFLVTNGTETNFSEVQLVARYAVPTEFLSYQHPLLFSDTIGRQVSVGIPSGTSAHTVLQDSTAALRGQYRPLHLGRSGTVICRLTSGAGGACNGTIQTLWWIGPEGSAPPGMG